PRYARRSGSPTTPGGRLGRDVRRPSGHHGALEACLGRPYASAVRGHEARGPRRDLGSLVGHMETLLVHPGLTSGGERPASEPVLVDAHSRVPYSRVAVDVDVLHVHHGGVGAHDIVDDARPAPAA